MTNYSQGHKAEQQVVKYLQKHGYKIRSTNWKTRWCEIDIVCEKRGCVYFVEVKYRSTTSQGRGLDYVTPNKLHQMAFAAELWIQDNRWEGDCCLAAVEVNGPEFQVSDMLILD